MAHRKSRKAAEVSKAKAPSAALIIVGMFVASSILGIAMYIIPDDEPKVTHGVAARFLTNHHETARGEQTDFVLVVENTGSHSDRYTVEVAANTGGFTDITIEEDYATGLVIVEGNHKPVLVHVTTSDANEGKPFSSLRIFSEKDPGTSTTVTFWVDMIDSFGNTVQDGDDVSVWYAGICVKLGLLFDTNNQTLIESDYPLLKPLCVGDQKPNTDDCYMPHYDPLKVEGVGSSSMIRGFDQKLLGMQQGQTLAVRIPAADAYGTDPAAHPLGGLDLIFVVKIGSIDS